MPITGTLSSISEQQSSLLPGKASTNTTRTPTAANLAAGSANRSTSVRSCASCSASCYAASPTDPNFQTGETPYGQTVPDTQDRGLLFVAFQSSIARAFGFVQTKSANRDDFQRPSDG